MTRKIKALGLAIVAVAAMSAYASSAAQASELHATTNAQTAVITGHSHVENVFQITPPNGPAVRCAQATFEATATDQGADASQLTAKEVTITATYAGAQGGACLAFGQAATVRMNGCNYTVTNSLSGVTTAKTAYVDIVNCTPGKQIEIQTGICQVRVGAQSNLQKITFANVAGAPHSVTGQVAISGITYEVSGALCGHAQNVLTHDGTYHGAINFQAYAHGGTEQKQEHGHTVTKYKHNGIGLGLLAT